MKVAELLERVVAGMKRDEFLRAFPDPVLVEMEGSSGATANGIEVTTRLPTAAIKAQSLASREARVLALPVGPLLVGRALRCGLIVEHASVSKEHAQVTRDAKGGITVTDLGSTNGTFVGGKRLDPKAPAAVPPDETIRFGRASIYQLLDPPGMFGYLEVLARFGM